MMFFLNIYDSVSLPNPTTLRQTNIAGWKMDPIEIGDIPASYVSLPEGTSKSYQLFIPWDPCMV